MEKFRDKGFTFIELMVVVSIAAILFSIATVTYSNVVKNSRDARRSVDMGKIQEALELCRSTNGAYPTSITGGSPITCGGKTFLSLVPKDPKEPSTYGYNYTSDGITYTLTTTRMEDAKNCDDTSSTTPCVKSVRNP